MEVGFIHPGYPWGEGTGATHSATRIVSGLAERDHEVTVYCTDPPPDGHESDAGPSVRFLGRSGSPYHSGLQLNRALRDRAPEFEAYDIVHSYLMRTIPAMADISARTSATTVVTLNAYGGVCPKNDLRYLDREPCTSNGLLKCTACSVATSGGHDDYGRTYRSVGRLGNLKLVHENQTKADQIDGYHALSSHVKDTYAAFDFPRDRISVIPNILDERFCRDHHSNFDEPYKLLYVGSLDKRKGVDKLVPVLDLLNRSSSEFRLTVVGDGGLRTDLKRQATERGLESAISFLGQLPNDELPNVFASHDLFFYPGRWDEPFGRVFLESLATGTPIIASDVGSVGDIIGQGGRTTDGSVNGFVNSIREVVEDRELRALSNRAKRKVMDYRSDVVVPRIVELYEQSL